MLAVLVEFQDGTKSSNFDFSVIIALKKSINIFISCEEIEINVKVIYHSTKKCKW